MDDDGTASRLRAAPWWVGAVLVVALVALATVVALGARGLPGREERPAPFSIDIDYTLMFKVLLVISAVLLLLIVVILLLPGGSPIELPERKKSSPLRLLVGIVVFFAIVNLVQQFMDGSEQSAATTTGEVAQQEEDSGGVSSGSSWSLVLLGGALLVGVVGIAAATRGAGTQSPADALLGDDELHVPAALSDEIDSVLSELEGQADARLLVIGAYARMERVLSSAGLPPMPTEAPLEYLARVLRRLEVSQSAVVRLTDLFQLARFSKDDVDGAMSTEAKAALEAIRDELAGVPT